MTLQIKQQPACNFRAVNTWTNGTIGGTEHVVGIVHNNGQHVTMAEIPEHPEDGTTARILGHMMDGQLAWEYAGLSSDSARTIVFGTVLTRGKEPSRASCPELLGTWSSGIYEALTVQADGTHNLLTDLSMSLEVAHQSGCAPLSGSAGPINPLLSQRLVQKT